MNIPELLMPAGDMERLKFACAFGADAVYAGVPRYSLRTRENGFVTTKNIQEAIEYVHSLNKRIYLAMNIFPHNNKVSGMLDAFCEFADLNPDGFIVTDIGVISNMRKLRPNVKIHISTQANSTNWMSIQFYRDLGVKRVVIPRELSLKEIQEIHDKVPDIELEAFVHGSMCMAYSGRCLISNYLTHRDSNQGNCANSCRWQYKLSSEKSSLKVVENEFIPSNDYKSPEDTFFVSEMGRTDQKFELDEDENGTYIFNSKDLCAIELIDDLRNAGVVSLKVEGRTKSLYYASIVARAYSKALEDLKAGKPFDPENLNELIGTSNRSLMTGFFNRRPQEYGQNYDDGGSHPLTHVFVGHLVEYDLEKQIAWIEFRNRVFVGDIIEWITPSGTQFTKIEKIYSKKMEELEKISGGVIGAIPVNFAPDKFSIIRKQIEKVVDNSATASL